MTLDVVQVLSRTVHGAGRCEPGGVRSHGASQAPQAPAAGGGRADGHVTLRETPLGFGSRVRCPRDLLSMILQQRRHATAFLVISGYWHLRDATLVTSCCHFDLILAAPALSFKLALLWSCEQFASMRMKRVCYVRGVKLLLGVPVCVLVCCE